MLCQRSIIMLSDPLKFLEDLDVVKGQMELQLHLISRKFIGRMCYGAIDILLWPYGDHDNSIPTKFKGEFIKARDHQLSLFKNMLLVNGNALRLLQVTYLFRFFANFNKNLSSHLAPYNIALLFTFLFLLILGVNFVRVTSYKIGYQIILCVRPMSHLWPWMVIISRILPPCWLLGIDLYLSAHFEEWNVQLRYLVGFSHRHFINFLCVWYFWKQLTLQAQTKFSP